MTAPIRPKKALDQARYQRMRAAGFSDEEIAADGFEIPSAAPADQVDQRVRNPDAGLDPAMRAVRGLSGYALGGAVGGGMGNLAARAMSKLGTSVAARLASGAVSGAVGGAAGGSAARAVDAATSGGDVRSALRPSGTDALFGGGLGLAVTGAGEIASGLGKWTGLNKKRIRADKTKDVLRKTAEAQGRSPEQMIDDIASRHGSQLAVTDVDPTLRALGRDVSRASPKAERQLEQFTKGRKSVPREQAVRDIERSLGAPARSATTTAEALEEAVKQADNVRFNSLFERHPGPIVDPEVTRQIQAVLENVSGARRALTQEQGVLMKPVAEVLQEMDGLGPVVTLKGLHRLKVMLDKANRVTPQTSDAAMKTGALKKAAAQLKELSLKNLGAAGQEYAQTLAASQAEREAIDALHDGAKALANGVTPDDVVAAIARYGHNPQALEMYRSGMGGAAKHMLGAGEDIAPIMVPNTAEKLRAAARSPQAEGVRRMSLDDLDAIQQTNKMQARTQQPTVLGTKDPLSTQFGEATALGGLATGTMTPGKMALPIGSMARSAIKGFSGKTETEALERLVPWLTSAAGKGSAARARKLLEESDILTKLRSRRYGTLAGAISGATGEQR